MNLLEALEQSNAALLRHVPKKKNAKTEISLVVCKEDGALTVLDESTGKPVDLVDPTILSSSSWEPYCHSEEVKPLTYGEIHEIIDNGGTVYTGGGIPVRKATCYEYALWMGPSYKKNLNMFDESYYAEKPHLVDEK